MRHRVGLFRSRQLRDKRTHHLRVEVVGRSEWGYCSPEKEDKRRRGSHSAKFHRKKYLVLLLMQVDIPRRFLAIKTGC